jgi:hypothetical protein
MDFVEKTVEVSNELSCKGCGGTLKFNPGTESLKCQYCGEHNEIASKPGAAAIEELDFEAFLATQADKADKLEVTIVKCENCGASTTLKPNIISDNCPFCASSLVVSNGTTSNVIRPKYVLPFKIDKKKAMEGFRSWIKGLWFAPNDLVRYSNNTDKLNGMYIPYWTYDSETSSNYTGRRGDYYYETEEYETTINGKTVTQTRQVRRIMWTYASGNVYKNFDDVLVLASSSLPESYSSQLEPWDLENLAGFDEKFLSGFRTETYQVDVKSGFEKAKHVMDDAIRDIARRDIGGDVQEVSTVDTAYNNITFKHILLPIWLSAYRYNSKVYRFMINGRTGEVQGERPYSWIKITLTILTAIAVIAGGYLAYRHYHG